MKTEKKTANTKIEKRETEMMELYTKCMIENSAEENRLHAEMNKQLAKLNEARTKLYGQYEKSKKCLANLGKAHEKNDELIKKGAFPKFKKLFFGYNEQFQKLREHSAELDEQGKALVEQSKKLDKRWDKIKQFV